MARKNAHVALNDAPLVPGSVTGSKERGHNAPRIEFDQATCEVADLYNYTYMKATRVPHERECRLVLMPTNDGEELRTVVIEPVSVRSKRRRITLPRGIFGYKLLPVEPFDVEAYLQKNGSFLLKIEPDTFRSVNAPRPNAGKRQRTTRKSRLDEEATDRREAAANRHRRDAAMTEAMAEAMYWLQRHSPDPVVPKALADFSQLSAEAQQLVIAFKERT